VVDPAIPQARSAGLSLVLSLWRTFLAQHGTRLLAVELIVTLGGAVVALPWFLAGVLPATTAAVAVVAICLSATAGTLLTAWAWSATLAILCQDLSSEPPPVTVGQALSGEPPPVTVGQALSGEAPPVTVGQALRAGLSGEGLRGVLRLWGWLLPLQVFNLTGLLIYWDADLAVAYLRSPANALVDGLSWYAVFATALLPMAVLLERRGLRRAWLLTHSKLSTAAGVVAMLALGWGVDWLLDRFLSGLAESLTSTVVGIPLAVLTTVGYYALYLAHTGEPTGDRLVFP
jgi:hypothetical protein